MSTLISSCCTRAYNMLPERATAFNVARNAAIGAMAAYTVSFITPISVVGGAIFGGVNAITSMAQRKIDKNIITYRTSLISGLFFVRTAISAVATQALSYPVTFVSACVLSQTMLFFNNVIDDCNGVSPFQR
jgi:hypothetical protein